MFVDLGILRSDRFEGRAADETQFAIAQRGDRSGSWPSIDHCHIAHNRAGPEDGENSLGAARRVHAHLEQALLQPITAVAGITGQKQDFIGRQFDRPGVRKKCERQPFGKIRQQIG